MKARDEVLSRWVAELGFRSVAQAARGTGLCREAMLELAHGRASPAEARALWVRAQARLADRGRTPAFPLAPLVRRPAVLATWLVKGRA